MPETVVIKWRDLTANPSLADGLVFKAKNSTNHENVYERPDVPAKPAKAKKAAAKSGKGGAKK